MPSERTDGVSSFIGYYLSSTADLDSLWSGAMLHALMHQWVSGPLPGDLEVCARIMRLAHVDATSIALAILQRYFMQQPDGGWIHAKSYGIKLDLAKRALRFSQRGKAGADARWREHRHQKSILGQNQDGPILGETGMQQAMLEHSLSIANNDASGMAVVPVLEFPNLSSKINLEGRMTRKRVHTGNVLKNASSSSSKGDPETGSEPPPRAPQKAKTGRTPRNRPVDAPEMAGTANDPTQPEKTQGRAKSPRKSTAKTPPSDPHKTKKAPDPRFAPFRREFFRFWRDNHPGGLNHPWGREDGNALNRLLKANPHMRLPQYKHLLVNRAKSDADLVNLSLAPASWMHRLTEFADGPWKAKKKVSAPSTALNAT